MDTVFAWIGSLDAGYVLFVGVLFVLVVVTGISELAARK